MVCARVAGVVVTLAASLCVAAAAPPAANATAPGKAAAGARAAGKSNAQADMPSDAAIDRLTREKAELTAELARKDQQIAALAKLLKDKGIDVPADLAAETDDDGAADGKPLASALRSAAGNNRSAADAPAAPAQDKGPWPVTVVSNEEPSQAELKEQLAEAIGKLKFADDNYNQAKQRHDRMAGEREWYTNGRGRGDYKPKYTNAQMGEPRREVAKAEAEKRRAQQTVARLERQIADAGKTHMVVGQLDDGTTVEITAAGAAQVQLARGLQTGERYRVAGTGRVDAGTLRVRMSSASPMAPAGDAAPAAAAAQASAPRRRVPAAAAAAPAPEPADAGAEEQAGEPPAAPTRRVPARPARTPKASPF